MEKAARIEFDRKIQRLGSFPVFNVPSAVRVLGMTLDVHDSVEIGIGHFNGNRDTIGQAVDDDVWTGEVTWRGDWFWYRY